MADRKENTSVFTRPRSRIAIRVGPQDCRAYGLDRESGNGVPWPDAPPRTAPTAPCSMTYEPGVTVIAQGRKRVDLGRTTFIYGESRYLLTAVDLPIVSQISRGQ